jgi:hypothetical protein
VRRLWSSPNYVIIAGKALWKPDVFVKEFPDGDSYFYSTVMLCVRLRGHEMKLNRRKGKSTIDVPIRFRNRSALLVGEYIFRGDHITVMGHIDLWKRDKEDQAGLRIQEAKWGTMLIVGEDFEHNHISQAHYEWLKETGEDVENEPGYGSITRRDYEIAERARERRLAILPSYQLGKEDRGRIPDESELKRDEEGDQDNG